MSVNEAEPKPRKFNLEFLLRHVDDEPSIADGRFLSEVVSNIIEMALGFAVVGEIEGATRLLETLRDRGIDPFQRSDRDYPFLKPCMYFAWDATSSWPAWVPDEERSEDNLQELETQGRGPWLERFSEDWVLEEAAAMKAMEMAYNGVTTTLPNFDGTLAGQVSQAENMWRNGEFSYAANPNGPMNFRYAKWAMWWRQGIYPYPYVQIYRTAGLIIALDVYLRLDQHDKARDVLEKVCGRFHMEEQVEQLACSRAAWKSYLTAPDRPLLDLLQTPAAKLRTAVTRAVLMTEQRLDTLPTRRYRNYDIGSLARTVSTNTFRNCPYDVLAAFRPPDNPRIGPGSEHGLLRPGCSPSEIKALEERLGVELPTDYKEFLSVTDGLGSMWDGQNVVDYLARAQDVCWQDIEFLEGNALSLLRDDDPSPYPPDRLDWPELPKKFRCICLHGEESKQDTNGSLFLLHREIIQPSKDYLFETYEKRSQSQRDQLDRVVQEMYGSLDVLLNLEYALVSWTPWDFTFHPYNGIHDLLERMAEASLHKKRPWSKIFEPTFRRMA
ncbi:uncharacterized protein N0V89_003681 [Didymosphaeria variabile]|uniref:Knr4/Smi1-like domain-containing protein n=1 Tax=Didymosphaeria variabile TaxID=1932322 RepID=A0A9W9CCX9_9PLEO|nr:uncharacterized protein N0V89_003681 [Didymosphaeria variabile]KAJ4355661.1 hypothetical protein N0V89_003681 [Didymosphaeria variabile]